jgi:hypothetical protein
MVLVIIGMTQALSIRYHAADVGGNAPPPAPTYLLFLYVLLAAPLLTRWNRKLGLARGELLLIYTMMLVAGPICHLYSIGFLIPHAVSPLYYRPQEPDWAVFLPSLPTWFAPRDPTAIQHLFRGGDGSVPWMVWLVPMLAWSSLLIALFFVALCINVLMCRQWVEAERLTFPLAAIPLALTDGSASEVGLRLSRPPRPGVLGGIGQPARILRQPLFWMGVCLPLLLRAPEMLHTYLPSVPDFPLHNIVLVNADSGLQPPWTGLGQIEFDPIFWLVGVTYLLPKEVAFSAWCFYLIRLLENMLAVWWGLSEGEPSVYENHFPAVYSQGAGAGLALAGITLWAARRHLRTALRRAFGKTGAAEDRGEFLSYRTAFLGAALGMVFILCWLCLAGMRLWVAVLFLGLLGTFFLVFARIRAEAGLSTGVIFWPKMMDDILLTAVGARYLRVPDLTVLYALRWMYHSGEMGAVMAAQMEGVKLADAGGLRGRRVGGTLILAVVVTVLVAFLWTLKTYYRHGLIALAAGQPSNMIGGQIRWSYENLVATYNSQHGPEGNGILALGGGALVAIALSSLRARFLWFPLHPIGYLAANAWGMQINWASFFIGWLVKVLVTRYGGMKIYQRLLPLFLGLIVGDMLHQGLWGMVAWLAGGRDNDF